MKKQLFSLLLALTLGLTMLAPAAVADEVSQDPFEEIIAEFAQAKSVEPYQVMTHPARVTSWTALRWAPSNSAPLMATYPAKQELTVRKETPNWLLAENTQTGDIGYISKKNVTAPEKSAERKDLNPTIGANGKTDLGVIDINGAFSLQCAMPAGYSIQLVRSAGDQMVAICSSGDPTKPFLQLSVGFDEKYASVARMNDLSDEEFAELEKTFYETDPMVEITYSDTGLGTRLMIARLSDLGFDYLDFLSIYRGYFVECVLVAGEKAEDRTLSDAQIQMCIDFLTEMDFVPAGADEVVKTIAGGTWVTNLTDYNSETNTVQAEVMHTITVPQNTAEALKVGDILAVGELLREEITSIEKLDEGSFLINDYITMINYGGEYHVYLYELEYLETLAKLTVTISDSLVILDNIDPETGIPLDTPVQYTVEEFKAMLAAESYPDFATDNVYVSFSETGEMLSVERFYSPAQ